MLKKILLFITAAYIGEILIIITLGSYLGTWMTICLSLASAALGIYIIKHQGMGMLVDMQRSIFAGNMRSDISDRMLLFIAGVLLVLPGFITDIIGLLLLVPWCRHRLINLLLAMVYKNRLY